MKYESQRDGGDDRDETADCHHGGRGMFHASPEELRLNMMTGHELRVTRWPGGKTVLEETSTVVAVGQRTSPRYPSEPPAVKGADPVDCGMLNSECGIRNAELEGPKRCYHRVNW